MSRKVSPEKLTYLLTEYSLKSSPWPVRDQPIRCDLDQSCRGHTELDPKGSDIPGLPPTILHPASKRCVKQAHPKKVISV